MVKIVGALLCRLRRIIVRLEKCFYRCVKQHRNRIIQVLHPLSVLLTLLAIGFFFICESCYVLPSLLDTSGLWFKLHFVVCLFMLHNVLGNMYMSWYTDTTFIGLPRDRWNPVPAEAHLWHLCTHCEMLVPPRAWHCRLCGCCTLKRDHHCNIVANCIGHTNQRYFVVMLLYMTIGSFLAMVYNMFFICSQTKSYIVVAEGSTFGSRFSWLIFCGGLMKINVCCLALTFTHLTMQVVMISRGSVLHTYNDRSYDRGFHENFKSVLGQRRYWTIVSPFVSSPLPHDGTHWQPTTELMARKPV